MIEIGACLAVINKLQTTIDGGVRLTLDLNPSESEIIKKLFDLKINNESEICVGFSKMPVAELSLADYEPPTGLL